MSSGIQTIMLVVD
ncbi:hypothetical protein C358_05107 [Cryptococcus neoformans MW-RSA852]|nr:hypothetical protein C358_05107 [Cryptococcus neoformans var. grubii MW-RSA852]